MNNITTMPEVKDTSGVANLSPASVSSSVPISTPASVPTTNRFGGPAVKPDLKDAWTDMDKDAETLKNAITGGMSKQGNVDIYAMPKEFQKHNTVAGNNFSMGAFVMIAGLLLFLLAGAFTALYFLSPDTLTKITGIAFKIPDEQTNKQVVTEGDILALVPPVATTTAETATTTASSTIATSTPPKETYLSYNIDLSKINTFSDYYSLITKYGSAYRISQIDSEKLIADSSPDLGVSKVMELRKSIPILNTLAQITDTVSEQTAQLNIVLADNVSKGVVDMLLENGQWKIDKEAWTLPPQNEQVTYIQGEDRDADGLTDKEEDLFTANKESADTDSDGYTDAVEVAGLYDPNKKNGKLVDSGKFGTYLAENGSFSIIRPSQWSQAKDNTDNSISFRGLDDHFIKIITVENYNKQNLDSLYINKFQVSQIDPLSRVENDSWNGILSPDGVSIYIMPKINQSKFYIVEYHVPNNTYVLEYKELFSAMLKSLVIKK